MSRITPSMAKNAIKRSLRSIIDPELSESEKIEIWRHFFSQCAYCGKALEKAKRDGHIDHLVPTTKGGTNHISNRVLSCPKCNGDEKREELWESFLKRKISDSKTREEYSRRIKDWIEKHSSQNKEIDENVLQLHIDEVCKAFDKAVVALKGKELLKSPYVMRLPDESYGRVIEFVFPHKSGGLCFIDVGRGLNSFLNPFHVIEGPVIGEPGCWILNNGAVIQQLLRSDREWDNWQRWLDFRESPEGASVEDASTMEALRRNGAVME